MRNCVYWLAGLADSVFYSQYGFGVHRGRLCTCFGGKSASSGDSQRNLKKSQQISYYWDNKRRNELYGEPNVDARVDTSELGDKAPDFRYMT